MRGAVVRIAFFGLAVACGLSAAACRDTSDFSTRGGHYEGSVVAGSFVRAGLAGDVRFCLTLDTDHLQDGPGDLTTSDGLFTRAPLRPIPQVWHDPLSTLRFGDGRDQNLLYAARPSSEAGADVLVIVSLMQEGDVEVRLLRGAPGMPGDGGADQNLFAVAALQRQKGSCPF